MNSYGTECVAMMGRRNYRTCVGRQLSDAQKS